MAYLKTSRTTLYRHLNKLKAMDILEEIQEGKTKKIQDAVWRPASSMELGGDKHEDGDGKLQENG